METEAYLPIIVKHPRDQKHPEANLPPDNKILRKRSYAFVTDLFIIGLINKGLMYTYISFLKTYFYQLTMKTQLLLESKMYDVHFVSLGIVFWGYFLMSYYWGEGKTPGKHIFGLKVHSPGFKYSSELHLTLRECFARTLGYFINCLTAGSLFAISFITTNSKGLPDWLSQTSVVTDEQMDYIDKVYFSPDFESDFLKPAMSIVEEKEVEQQLSLFEDQKLKTLESVGTVIELPAPQLTEANTSIDQNDEDSKAA